MDWRPHSPLGERWGMYAYRTDFEDMSAKSKAHKIHVAIFCSPHNPSGRGGEKKWRNRTRDGNYRKYDVTAWFEKFGQILFLKGHAIVQRSRSRCEESHRCHAAPSKTLTWQARWKLSKRLHTMPKSINMFVWWSHWTMNVMSMAAESGMYQEEGYEWLEELVDR